MSRPDFLTTLRTANIKRQPEWGPNPVDSPSFRGNELAGEVGEACNILKKIDRLTLGLKGAPPNEVMVAALREELGDVLVCLDLVAMLFGIDLVEATREKFNLTSAKYKFNTRIAEDLTVS